MILSKSLIIVLLFCSTRISLAQSGGEDSTMAPIRDSIKSKQSLSVLPLGLQIVGGEAVFAGVFFGLNGKALVLTDTSRDNITPGLVEVAAIAVSSAAVDIIGNALYGKSVPYWHTLLGGTLSILLMAPFNVGASNHTETYRYIVISTIPLAGEIALYYLWPGSVSSGDAKGFRVQPFLTPWGGNINLYYPF